MVQHAAQVVLECPTQRQCPSEPALHRPARRLVIEVIEQGDVAVQTHAGVEPREQAERDNEGGVAQPEVIWRSAVLRPIGSAQTPALLVDDELYEAAAIHVVRVDAELTVGVPARTWTGAPIGEGAVVTHLVAQLQHREAMASDMADEIELEGGHDDE